MISALLWRLQRGMCLISYESCWQMMSEFVVPALARAIDTVLNDRTTMRGISIRTIAFSEHDVRIGGAKLSQVGPTHGF